MSSWATLRRRQNRRCSQIASDTMTDRLPNGISEILDYLAVMARGYDNHLKWNEVAKLKADLMNARTRWKDVSVLGITEECSRLGMRSEDVATIGALVTKAQAGRRLVPSGGYRYFQFNQPLDPA